MTRWAFINPETGDAIEVVEGTVHLTSQCDLEKRDRQRDLEKFRLAVVRVYVNHVGQEGRGAAEAVRDSVLDLFDQIVMRDTE